MSKWPGIVNAEVMRGAKVATADGKTVNVSAWMLRLEVERGTILLPLVGLLAAAGPEVDKALDQLQGGGARSTSAQRKPALQETN